MRRQLLPSIVMMVVFTVVLGIVFPLVITGIASVGFPDAANGSEVKVDGKVVGSSLLGQTFTEPKYFHGRPSAAGRRSRAKSRRAACVRARSGFGRASSSGHPAAVLPACGCP